MSERQQLYRVDPAQYDFPLILKKDDSLLEWAKRLRRANEKALEGGYEFKAVRDTAIEYEKWVPLDPEESKIMHLLLDAGLDTPKNLRIKLQGWR